MRLWYWKLIPGLPRQQLLGQWRECCLIAKDIDDNGTPNHILVNPIMEYSFEHFISYCVLVADEMHNRGYHVNVESINKHLSGRPFTRTLSQREIFKGWHTDEYLRQCYYNLEEKHDRGGMTDEEWEEIQNCIKRSAL